MRANIKFAIAFVLIIWMLFTIQLYRGYCKLEDKLANSANR